jgi:hypothetical protein
MSNITGLPQYWRLVHWHALYNRMPWLVNKAVGYYYSRDILDQDVNAYMSWGTGISIKPAGIRYPFFAYRENEWIIAWTNPHYSDRLFTKPSFGDRIIGVHALFKKDYEVNNIYSGGDMDKYPLQMQRPLSNFLKNLRIELNIDIESPCNLVSWHWREKH